MASAKKSNARRRPVPAAQERKPDAASPPIVSGVTAAPRVVTYRPNWQVSVDGREVQSFMLSPSFIGLDLPAGAHQVRAEYRASPLKTGLLTVGGAALLAVICFRRRLRKLEALFSASR